MNTQRTNHRRAGFTLIEILIVIGVIAILAAIVLVAVNPAEQFRKANNAQRSSNVNAILNAVGQYTVDNKGALPGGISTSDQEISDNEADLCDDLIPEYLPALPADPELPEQSITDCDDYETNYEVSRDSDNRVTVSAPDADGETISVTR